MRCNSESRNEKRQKHRTKRYGQFNPVFERMRAELKKTNSGGVVIIFGTRGVTTTPDRGEFFCPSCGSSQPYALKRVRRFFTLYFLPLIPLEKLGEYIRCDTCSGEFEAGVLQYDPESVAREINEVFHLSIRRLMAHLMIKNGFVNSSQLAQAVAIYRYQTQAGIDESDLAAEMERVRTCGEPLQAVIDLLPQDLTDQAKETLVRVGCEVAAIGGAMSQDSLAMVGQVAMEMGMTPAHFRGVMQGEG